jgi:signal transduction histidine kinase
VNGVRGELRQLFANVLSNSLDAVERYSGRVHVHIRGSRQPQSGRCGVRVTIADNGSGIDAAHLPRIFDPFFTTKRDVGTGLGLWVSKGIVEKHGGSMRVRSGRRPGSSGTVVSIFLPQDAAGRQQTDSRVAEKSA